MNVIGRLMLGRDRKLLFMLFPAPFPKQYHLRGSFVMAFISLVDIPHIDLVQVNKCLQASFEPTRDILSYNIRGCIYRVLQD